VDEGAPLAALLSVVRGSASAAYLDRLLAAFPSNGSAPRAATLAEPPTARELDVLHMLAAGRSNSDIAHELVLEQSTVKTHLIHLYAKLSVHSRTQAVARARELQLLD
jgi:LuxR family maltose regulon positive regulatory protein